MEAGPEVLGSQGSIRTPPVGEIQYGRRLGRSDHAAIARAYGMSASRVEDPADLAAAMREALTAPGPYLLDVVTQPLEEANAPVSKWIA